jgi:uncharacterized alpha-E superfamily protein
MLSRVAESLYWMSRYVERAECIARLVSVNHQILIDLDLKSSDAVRQNWGPLITSLNIHGNFRKKGVPPTVENITEYLIFDHDNPSSLRSCLKAARENARAVREQISTDMWEHINRTYLWLWGKSAQQFFQRDLYAFLDQIKESSILFDGLSNNTMLHEEGWDFFRVGKFLERADFTSRVLDDKFHLVGKLNPLVQWGGVLRSCSAKQAYQQKYLAEVTPVLVAKFLILSDTFPRSILYSIQQIDNSLRLISGVRIGTFSNEAEKISGRALARLRFSTIEDYWNQGLHKTADDIQLILNELHQSITETYFCQKNPVKIHVEETIRPSIIDRQMAQQQQ